MKAYIDNSLKSKVPRGKGDGDNLESEFMCTLMQEHCHMSEETQDWLRLNVGHTILASPKASLNLVLDKKVDSIRIKSVLCPLFSRNPPPRHFDKELCICSHPH